MRRTSPNSSCQPYHYVTKERMSCTLLPLTLGESVKSSSNAQVTGHNILLKWTSHGQARHRFKPIHGSQLHLAQLQSLSLKREALATRQPSYAVLASCSYCCSGLFLLLPPPARSRHRVPNVPTPGDHMHAMCE